MKKPREPLPKAPETKTLCSVSCSATHATCIAVGRQFSHRSRLFLNFDCVFLAEILSDLSKERTETWPESIHSLNCFAKDEADQSIRQLPLPQATQGDYRARLSANMSARVANAWKGENLPSNERRARNR